MPRKRVLLLILILIICSCSSALSQSSTPTISASVSDFDSCIAAGNKVLRSYPPKCLAPGIGVFPKAEATVDPMPPPKRSDPLRLDSKCKDLCGDGQCAEMVCQAQGCPCAETHASCPLDCRN